VIYKRVNILKIVETFLEDSQVISGIFVIFRKSIQVLSNDSHHLVDKSMLNISPDEFALSIKVNFF
jgi:hypothetical protein